MKTCILFTALSAALFAQTPVPSAIPGDTVVATVDGKNITAEQIRHFLETAPPQLLGTAQLTDAAKKSASEFMASFSLINYLAGEAEKHHLADEAPYKEQLDSAREQILANGMVSWERNNHQVTNEEVEAYYKSNLSNYQQVHIRGIKIAFKPGAVTSVTSQKDIEEAAKAAVAIEHAGTTRTEAEAKKLAAEIVEKARGGADFAKLAGQYSDDADTKASGRRFRDGEKQQLL
jgi:hypothetical protein